MRKKISSILERNRIFDYGITNFCDISMLINCAAKRAIPTNCKSVIVCLFPYYWGESDHQNLCKYACLPDYHGVIKPILKQTCKDLLKEYPDEQFVSFVDSSPIPEVEAAVKAGLGVRGKNNLLLTKKHGSFVFIGEIATTLNLKPSKYQNSICDMCGKCELSCPNNAITENGVDYNRCISNITQKKGELTEEEQAAVKMGELAWGCDICQNVCPVNACLNKTHLNEFLNDIVPIITCENIDTLLQTRSFAYRGKNVIKRNLDIINTIKST